jgi:hypothetical protein
MSDKAEGAVADAGATGQDEPRSSPLYRAQRAGPAR